MIDLHSHTDQSDGTDAPQSLIELALIRGLTTLAITDHDTFAAHDQLGNYAAIRGLRLITGVEISTKAHNRSVHLLAYWFGKPVPATFRTWLGQMLEIRRERNRRLISRLHELGLQIELKEAEALGRTVTGRVHIAKVLIQKGYATSINDAFNRYIGEDAPGFVLMEDPKTADAVQQVRAAGGVPVIAHPIRLKMTDPEFEESFLSDLTDAGLLGLEVMHSDQDATHQQRYLSLAQKLGLAPSGGSDYHGSVKPDVHLGRGMGNNIAVPQDWLDRLSTL